MFKNIAFIWPLHTHAPPRTLPFHSGPILDYVIPFLVIPLSDGQLDALAQVELNGRQIKNVLKTAQMLVRQANGDGKVDMGHIETILAIERGKEFSRA